MNHKEKIPEIKKSLEKMDEIGKDQQFKGNDLCRFADEAKGTLSYFESKDKLDETDTELIDAYVLQLNGMNPSVFRAPQEDYYNRALGLASLTATYSTAHCEPVMINSNLERIFLSGVKPNLVFPVRIITEKSELERYLDEFCEEFEVSRDFVSLKESAWASLYNPSPEKSTLAANPMRLVFNEVIRTLAPTEKVKEQSWWEPANTESEVGPAQRIRFLLEGSGLSGSLKDISSKFNKYFSTTQSLAHGGNEAKEELKSCLIMMEHALLAIFRARKGNKYFPAS